MHHACPWSAQRPCSVPQQGSACRRSPLTFRRPDRVRSRRDQEAVSVIVPDIIQTVAADPLEPPGEVAPPWTWQDTPDGLTAYGVLASVIALGAIPGTPLHTASEGDLFYFVALAVCTQYIGAHRGLTTTQRQQLSVKDGFLAPVAASVSLFLCYVIIKYFPNVNITSFLNAYFWLLGSFAVSGALNPVLKQLGGALGEKTLYLDTPKGWVLDDQGEPVEQINFSPTDLAAVILGVGVSTAHLITQDYNLNNLLACLIASDILQLIGIRSFRVAGALLCGLLIYDVFWVFASPSVVGANVMMTVATSDMITGPSRLLFPKIPGGTGEAADFPFSLLGLGDIAVPGLLACLALRFDASRAVDMEARAAAAFAAMQAALVGLPAGTSGRSMGEASATAADAAYDRVADAEQHQRNHTGGSPDCNTGSGHIGSNGAGADDKHGKGSKLAGVAPTAAVLSQRTYFVPVMVAYVGGLLAAFAANSITGLGQPALLYIVPSVLGAVVVLGATREELRALWAFTDVPSFGIPKSKEAKDAPK